MRKLHLIILIMLLTLPRLAFSYSDHRKRSIDSIETLVNSANPPQGDNLIRAYCDLMWGYLQTDGDKSKAYAEKVIELSTKARAYNAHSDALRILGLNAYGHDDYDMAIEYFNEALSFTELMKGDKRYKESDVDNNLSNIYGSMANVYNMQDKASLAIHYYQLALPIFEKYGWNESTAILYYNIGELYNSMGNEAETEANYLKSAEYAKASGDSLLIAMPNKGLAKMYSSKQEYNLAEQAAQVCYNYYKNHIEEERNDYIVTLLILARMQLNHYNNTDKCKDYIVEAQSLINEDIGSETLGDFHNACCELAMHNKDWRKAEQHAWEAINAGDAVTYNDLGSYVYLTQIYAELGETEKVKECVTTIFNGMLQFATSNYQSNLAQMEVIYETEKKQATIENLKKERHWYTIGSILVGCILLLLIVLFFVLWRNVRQSKQNAIVRAKLDGEMSERVRIAHDLHDRIGGLLTAIKLNIEPDSQAAALAEQAQREVRNVAHNLLPDSLKRHGLKTALSDYCSTVRNVSFAYIGSEQRINNEDAVYCIVHELVNNAAQHANAQHIKVQLTVDNGFAMINVSDDGNGLISNDNEEGGLGYIKQRVDAIGGVISICSKPGVGSEINIELKKTQSYDKHYYC